MKQINAYIYQPGTISGGYDCELYLSPTSNKIRVGDILTDSSSNKYSVTGFYNPGNPSQTNLTNLFADGWTVELEYITTDTQPQEDTDYNSTIESPTIPGYKPEVAWSAIPDSVSNSVPAYNYQCNLSTDVATDPGSGSVEVGYYFVDNGGNIYRIEEVISASSPITIRLYDIAENDDNTPPSTSIGFVYEATKSAVGMSQALFYRLNQDARDIANNIEKGIAWENRGVELKINENQYKNVTKLDVLGLNYLGESESGWNGGSELQGETSGGNKKITGFSGFSSHEMDGTNNDVNSFIEWDNTDRVHYHRCEPQQDGQDLDINVGFQFPSYFDGVNDSGNVFEFYGKADDGSSDGVNKIELVALIDTDGTEYTVTGKQVTVASKTTIALTKGELDSILNPSLGSSSSSSNIKEWDSSDAGKIIYARFKLYGNSGDKIYLDQDNAFLYI